MQKNIISKIKKAQLTGRGGACFPTATKWESFNKAPGKTKYIICNAAEGDPTLSKDGYLLDNHLDEVISGINIALKTFGAKTVYFYLRPDYYNKYKNKIKKIAGNKPIVTIKKQGGYLGGEETVVAQVIEGKRAEPRIKPPFLSNSGVWQKPTLINNVETFYHISKIDKNEYNGTRFYSISGQVRNAGIFELPERWSIKKVLSETNNWPGFEFFVHAGSGICGKILLSNEINKPLKGLGSIIVYSKQKTNVYSLMKKWVDFFLQANCDKCTPCREGIFRIAEMVNKKNINKQQLDEITFALQETSFCGLGRAALIPFRDITNKLMK